MDQTDIHRHPVSKGVRIALTSALVLLALFLLSKIIQNVENFGPDTTHTISVTGTGQATVPPDVARISFTVQNTATTVADAQSKTTTQANAAISALSSEGVADKDVTTLSYNVNPQYSYPNCTPGVMCPTSSPKVTGYQVSESVQVTIHDLTKVATILSDLGSQNVQNISGPNFGLADVSEGTNAARADAIQDAKAQATQLAKELGVSLGKIVDFSESSNSTYPQPVFSAMASAGSTDAASTPNLPAGDNTYNANVTITYEIR